LENFPQQVIVRVAGFKNSFVSSHKNLSKDKGLQDLLSCSPSSPNPDENGGSVV
jgi:hypothetical protein